MDSVGGDDDADSRSLRSVGPSTAAVIERAPFDAADVRRGRVSNRMLLDAGVDADAADRLRREYRLLWDFYWRPGEADLPTRAAKMGGATEAERRWVAASAADWTERPAVATETESEPEPIPDVAELPPWPDVSGLDAASNHLSSRLGEASRRCPRCEGAVTRFRMGERQSHQCSACGYVGIRFTRDDDAWRRAVDRLIRGRLG